MNTGFVRHFVACNEHDPSRFVPLFVNGQRLGLVEKPLAKTLCNGTEFFVDHDGGIALDLTLNTYRARSDALMKATLLIAQKQNKPLREELYPVIETWGDEPLAEADRIAMPWFGFRAWGVHVNGFVRKKDGLHLWIGERAADRQVAPGKLDNMIGGGHPLGLTLEENLCKEAKEEAGVDPALALTAKYIGPMDYMLDLKLGVRNDTLFLYDLELPESFTPHNTDGEVARYHLMPLAEVAKLVRETDRFKFNCNMVIADFLFRHGTIAPTDAEYDALNEWLSRRPT